ncbi:MAG TPA: RNA polymerase sigma factor [Gemmatimonadaceae bacterium]|nr:RNA polymerase sigma factor [Gemmatimonadaceae bacterium]
MISVDPATLAQAKAGDLEAFAAIVRLYQPRCLRFARSMLRNPQDAEEAVQDAWMRVYRALPRYEDQERFDSWLFRILANRCRTRSIRMVRDQRTMVHDHPAMDIAETAHPAEQDAWREEIRHALDELPEAQREAFLLHHVEGLAYEEIAAVSGVGVSALKMRVKRACDHLRGRLQEVARD